MSDLPADRSVIRRARVADLPEIGRRWRELMDMHAGLDPDLYALEPHAEGTYTAGVRAALSDRHRLVLVAEAPGASAGAAPPLDAYLLAGLGLRQPIFRVREVGMIFDLAVRPAARRRGLGRALVAAAEAWFAEQGVHCLQVDFAPENALSGAFWRDQGFRTLLSEAYRLR